MSVAVLFVVVLAFAWNLGAHYTGAVMGMPYAARAVSLGPALVLVAIAALLGAALASHGVERTVGHDLVDTRRVTIADGIAIVSAAGLLTALFNWRRIPTSTIQILVFCFVGMALAAGIPVRWATVGHLAIVWALAPPAAWALGFAFTRLLDRVLPGRPGAVRLLPALLVCVGVLASFVMGANDVANATGALVLTDQAGVLAAGAIGGAAMAAGILTWGRRILSTVAFDLVRLDLNMASAAQGVQALVVLAAVTQGFFTSMNQALIAAMAGTGMARGRRTVEGGQLLSVLRGWVVGPAAGLAVAFVAEELARALS